MSCRLFLFDLDGTIADTAPDLVRAANLVRTVRGLDPLPDTILRPMASRGAPGLIGTCFGIQKTDPAFPALRDEFLRN
ncbi:MAG: HAD family hydrolase, partial [Sutterella sp.]